MLNYQHKTTQIPFKHNGKYDTHFMKSPKANELEKFAHTICRTVKKSSENVRLRGFTLINTGPIAPTWNLSGWQI